MKQKRFSAFPLLAAFVLFSGCPTEGELGFRSTDQELIRELRIALKEANISFQEDEEGFLRYRREDAGAATRIRETLEQELHSGVAVKYEDIEATQYLREMLISLGMKYRVENRADGEWTRWYPQNEQQEKEIPMKMVEHVFEIKKRRLSTNCKEGTSPLPTSLNNSGIERAPKPC